MQLSAAGLDLIKRSEGFRANVYRDSDGAPTIGYGHHLVREDSFASGIDEAMADHILACDVDDVTEQIERLVKVPLTQGQFDALVDFVFNLGAGRLESSTLLKKLNAGDYAGAGVELLLWDHVNGAVSDALEARRKQEYQLWRGLPSATDRAL